MRYRLRTLVLVLALGPPVLAGVRLGWPYALAIVGFLIFSAIPLGCLIWLLDR